MRFMIYCVETRVSAPKARNAKAWAIGPGRIRSEFLALKARNNGELSEIIKVFKRDQLFRAFSAIGLF